MAAARSAGVRSVAYLAARLPERGMARPQAPAARRAGASSDRPGAGALRSAAVVLRLAGPADRLGPRAGSTDTPSCPASRAGHSRGRLGTDNPPAELGLARSTLPWTEPRGVVGPRTENRGRGGEDAVSWSLPCGLEIATRSPPSFRMPASPRRCEGVVASLPGGRSSGRSGLAVNVRTFFLNCIIGTKRLTASVKSEKRTPFPGARLDRSHGGYPAPFRGTPSIEVDDRPANGAQAGYSW
jgi:hypothetical protein